MGEDDIAYVFDNIYPEGWDIIDYTYDNPKMIRWTGK